MEVLAVQERAAECSMAAIPVPESAIWTGEFVALLATITLPGRGPVEDGVNVAVIVATCPEARICPVETPLTLYPAPEIETLEIVTVEFPAFVKVKLRTLAPPMVTLPKDKLVVLGLRTNVAGFTVSVAALLVALPALLLTVTVNCAALSVLVVAGVV